MTEYHKIDTIFKRNPDDGFKTLLLGQYSRPEFEYLANNEWVFTEKIDGTNVRILIEPAQNRIGFGGKTDNAQLSTKLIDALADLFHPHAPALVEDFPNGAVFYGEGYGPKIQAGGGRYRSEPGFILFDVKVGNWWLTREGVENVGTEYGLDVVPIVGRGPLSLAIGMAREGYKSTFGDFAAEGIVARPAVEMRDRGGERIITKIKHKDFADMA